MKRTDIDHYVRKNKLVTFLYGYAAAQAVVCGIIVGHGFAAYALGFVAAFSAAMCLRAARVGHKLRRLRRSLTV